MNSSEVEGPHTNCASAMVVNCGSLMLDSPKALFVPGITMEPVVAIASLAFVLLFWKVYSWVGCWVETTAWGCVQMSNVKGVG